MKRSLIPLVCIVAAAALGYAAGVFTRPGTPPAGETMTVKVFFMNDTLDPEITCQKVFPVTRTVAKTSAVARAALTELLKGPTAAEKAQGYLTVIPAGVRIQKLSVDDGTAYADFDETLERSVGGSCRVSAIRAQLTQTLRQFPTVKNVVLSIDGRTEDILQP